MNCFKPLYIVFILSFIITSCDISKTKDVYYDTPKIKEVWIWDKVEYRTNWETEIYTTEEEWRDNFFYTGGGSHSFWVPYAFVFYENGYYDYLTSPFFWNQYLNDFEDGDGTSTQAQLWKIEDSYFYTTWSRWKAKRDDEFGKAYKVISNDNNTIVLKPIYGAINYGGGWGDSYYEPWSVTLKKKQYSDFQYDPTVWW